MKNYIYIYSEYIIRDLGGYIHDIMLYETYFFLLSLCQKGTKFLGLEDLVPNLNFFEVLGGG